MSTEDLQGALSHSADVAFLLQGLEMAEDSVRGGDPEPGADLLVGGGVAFLPHGPDQEVVDQFLPVSKAREHKMTIVNLYSPVKGQALRRASKDPEALWEDR